MQIHRLLCLLGSVIEYNCAIIVVYAYDVLIGHRHIVNHMISVLNIREQLYTMQGIVAVFEYIPCFILIPRGYKYLSIVCCDLHPLVTADVIHIALLSVDDLQTIRTTQQ